MSLEDFINLLSVHQKNLEDFERLVAERDLLIASLRHQSMMLANQLEPDSPQPNWQSHLVAALALSKRGINVLDRSVASQLQHETHLVLADRQAQRIQLEHCLNARP